MWQAFRAKSSANQQLVEIDAGVVLILLSARYYDPSRGQFLSQDPIHQLVGDPKRIAERNSQDMQKLLEDPQMLNSYNYGRSNPLRYSDKKGECVELFSAAFCTTVFYAVLIPVRTNSDSSFRGAGFSPRARNP
jgi:RHS repeat-associated protein